MMALSCRDRLNAWLKAANYVVAGLSLPLVLAIPACRCRPGASAVGSPAPPATWNEKLAGVTDLDNQPISSLSTAGAKAVVLIFVRTDCPVANHYAPEFERLHRRYTRQGVDFWLVYPDPETQPPEIHRHLDEYHLSIKALRDPTHQLVKCAGVSVTPEAAVFLPSGHEVYHGRIDDRYPDFGKERPTATTHDLEDAVNALLQGKPVPASNKAVGCYIADLASRETGAAAGGSQHP